MTLERGARLPAHTVRPSPHPAPRAQAPPPDRHLQCFPSSVATPHGEGENKMNKIDFPRASRAKRPARFSRRRRRLSLRQGPGRASALRRAWNPPRDLPAARPGGARCSTYIKSIRPISLRWDWAEASQTWASRRAHALPVADRGFLAGRDFRDFLARGRPRSFSGAGFPGLFSAWPTAEF